MHVPSEKDTIGYDWHILAHTGTKPQFRASRLAGSTSSVPFCVLTFKLGDISVAKGSMVHATKSPDKPLTCLWVALDLVLLTSGYHLFGLLVIADKFCNFGSMHHDLDMKT